MKLAISNIAWDSENNEKVYRYLSDKGFSAIEIAPTKLFPSNPYSHIEEAKEYAKNLYDEYGLSICSMQSIWYGQNGNIFHSDNDRLELQEYTFKAVDFAVAIGCKNLVFGNPKARNRDNESCDDKVAEFFCNIANYAVEKGTYIALEPNPTIYNTNFINYTQQAFDYCNSINNNNLRVNVDLGTVICNKESLDCVKKNIHLVNHIHISEPYLAKIEKRELHKQLRELDYNNYISIEMGNQNNINDLFEVIDYVSEVLGNE